MERSEELVGLMHRMYEAMRGGDVSGFESMAVADLVAIGTDPNEWWDGRDTAVAAFREQTQAMGGGFPVKPGDPIAYAHGDVGWIADRATLTGPDGSGLPFRLTVVVVRDGGDWKIAQMHFSVGVPNEQAFGQELPT